MFLYLNSPFSDDITKSTFYFLFSKMDGLCYTEIYTENEPKNLK